jgi:hypothetical protein
MLENFFIIILKYVYETVNRQIAENSILTKRRKSNYAILPIFFIQKDVLVQNGENLFFSIEQLFLSNCNQFMNNLHSKTG